MKRRKKRERLFNTVEQYRAYDHDDLDQFVIAYIFCIMMFFALSVIPVFKIVKSLVLNNFGSITIATVVEKPQTAPYGSYVQYTQKDGKPMRIHIPDGYPAISAEVEILHFPRFPRFLATTPELNKIDWFNNLGIILMSFILSAPVAWELFKIFKAYRSPSNSIS